MTTHPDFIFDKRTGELERHGKRIALNSRHTKIMRAILSMPHGQHISSEAIVERTGLSHLSTRISELRRRLEPVGILIEGKFGYGYRIVMGDMPRWQPNIPPPVTIESIG